MRRIALTFGIVAAFGLLSGTPAAAMATQRVLLCHGGFVDLPVGHGRKPGDGKGCPLGCHAPLCQDRKKRHGNVDPISL